MTSTSESILAKIKNLDVNTILQWMIANLELAEIRNCVTQINTTADCGKSDGNFNSPPQIAAEQIASSIAAEQDVSQDVIMASFAQNLINNYACTDTSEGCKNKKKKSALIENNANEINEIYAAFPKNWNEMKLSKKKEFLNGMTQEKGWNDDQIDMMRRIMDDMPPDVVVPEVTNDDKIQILLAEMKQLEIEKANKKLNKEIKKKIRNRIREIEDLLDELGYESAFGVIQSIAAEKNIYVTGARFGKDDKPGFFVYVFDNKNREWVKNRNNRPSGEWKTLGSLKSLFKKQAEREKGTFPSSKDIGNFVSKFSSVQMPTSKFNYRSNYQLKPLHPSSFGYIQKFGQARGFPVCRSGMQLYPMGRDAYFNGRHQGVSSNFSQQFSEDHGLWNPNEFGQARGFPVCRSGMQLYPLGKDAYFKGRHQGVSSNFSQQFSEDHGLWNPSPMVPAPNHIVGQFQYGSLKKKTNHHFGSSKPVRRRKTKRKGTRTTKRKGVSYGKKYEPNTLGMVKSAYTGKMIPGIPVNLYGYKGTQWTYGGNTGVGGYPALSSQGLQQGLIPFPMPKK